MNKAAEKEPKICQKASEQNLGIQPHKQGKIGQKDLAPNAFFFSMIHLMIRTIVPQLNDTVMCSQQYLFYIPYLQEPATHGNKITSAIMYILMSMLMNVPPNLSQDKKYMAEILRAKHKAVKRFYKNVSLFYQMNEGNNVKTNFFF